MTAVRCAKAMPNHDLFDAGQFFQNTNWFMTGLVLAWVAVTVGYVIVRATESLDGLSLGLRIYGIWVLVVEVSNLLAVFCLWRLDMMPLNDCHTDAFNRSLSTPP